MVGAADGEALQDARALGALVVDVGGPESLRAELVGELVDGLSRLDHQVVKALAPRGLLGRDLLLVRRRRRRCS